MAKQNLQNEGGRYSLKGSCLWGILLFSFLIIIDLLTKAAAEIYFQNGGKEIDIIPNFIWIDFTYNKGISYGLGADAPPSVKIGVIAATAVVMLLLAIMYLKADKRRSLLRIALVFIVAGGVGNLIDRVYFKVWDAEAVYGVRDMVNLSKIGFGICNFADFFITFGAVMLVLAFLFFDRDAIKPVGKYKALAKEAEEKAEAKKAEKLAKKAAEKQAK